jgi:hypothetical protein
MNIAVPPGICDLLKAQGQWMRLSSIEGVKKRLRKIADDWREIA